MVISIPNIIADRYATEEMKRIFSKHYRAVMDRELWITVMKVQKELGVDIPAEDIEKFVKAKEDIDFDLIAEISSIHPC